MAKNPRFQIGNAAERIDQRAVGRFGDGVDGQVTAGQIVFEPDLRCRMENKAGVAMPALALGASERVLLVRFGMQENREVTPDRLESSGSQRVRRRTDDHIVAILHRQSEQFVADCSAHHVDLHAWLA